MKSVLLYLLYVISATAYMIDQDNYFYINSSFNRQTTSLSMCFRFTQPATIQFQTQLFGIGKEIKMLAELDDQHSVRFSPAFDSDNVGYNNYDSGEYWVGIKVPYDNNDKQNTFEKVKMVIIIGDEQYSYVLLSPLFRLMLNAFEVAPTNTLYKFQDWLLISYLFREGEVDAYFFQKKNVGGYKILEQPEWGFKRDDDLVNYERYKSKLKTIITIDTINETNKRRLILNPGAALINQYVVPQQKYNFGIDELRYIAHEVGQANSNDL